MRPQHPQLPLSFPCPQFIYHYHKTTNTFNMITKILLLLLSLSLSSALNLPPTATRIVDPLPAVCNTPLFVDTAQCVCFLFISGKRASNRPAVSRRRCLDNLPGGRPGILALKPSCKRFRNSSGRIDDRRLLRKMNTLIRTCINPEDRPLRFVRMGRTMR